MPGPVGFLVGAAAAASQGASAGVVIGSAFVTALGFIHGSKFIDRELNKFREKGEERDQPNGKTFDVTRKGLLEKVPVQTGRRELHGIETFIGSRSDATRFLYKIITVAEGPCKGPVVMYADDDKVCEWDQTTREITYEPKYENRIVVDVSYGEDTQLASELMMEAQGVTNAWTNSGFLCLNVRFEWIDDGNHPFSEDPIISLVNDGLLMPAITNLNGPKRFSKDCMEVIVTYARSMRFGNKIPDGELDIPTALLVQSKLNVTRQYTATESGPEIESNAIIDTAKPTIDNLIDLLENYRTSMVWRNGKYFFSHIGDKILVGDTVVRPVMHVTPDMITSDVTMSSPGVGSRYTQVTIRFPDPSNDWDTNEETWPPTSSTQYNTYLREDNGVPYVMTKNKDHITNKHQAAWLAESEVKQSRDLDTFSFTATAETKELVPGDPFTLSWPNLGKLNQLVYVETIDRNDDETCTITCKELRPRNFDFSSREVTTASSFVKRFVGDTGNIEAWTWDNTLATYVPTSPIATPNTAVLPAPQRQTSDQDIVLNEVVVDRMLDRATNPFVVMRFSLSLSDKVKFARALVYGEIYNTEENRYESLGNAIRGNPSRIIHTNELRMPMDGKQRTVRFFARISGNRFNSNAVTFTVPDSKFNTGATL